MTNRNALKCTLGVVLAALFLAVTWSTTAARLSAFATNIGAVKPNAVSSAPKELMALHALAQSAATVATDKSDYAPGSAVTVTGSGWAAGETVTLSFAENPNIDGPHVVTTAADGQGNINDNHFVVDSFDGGLAFTLTATGGTSGQTATTTFTDSPPPQCNSGDGSGVVTITVPVNGSSCLAFTPAQGGGPDNWEVVEGGTYIMTITGVTECTGNTITVFIQSTPTGNFCFNASGGSGTYAGSFTMPNPACFTYPISYKCGASQTCDNACTFNAKGPSGANSVHLRASIFSNGCSTHVADENCDPTPPQGCTITCPPAATVECGASTDPSATGTPTTTGDCTATHTDSSVAACGNTRVITRTWKVRDSAGVESTCDQTITVVDTTPPTIGNPGPNATIECPNTPVFTAPTASDTCGTATVIEDHDVTTPGTCTGTYSRTKTWHAEDACGNHSGTKSQTITVEDHTAPTIGNPGPNGSIECPAAPVFTPPTASDTCSTATVILDSDVITPGCGGTYSETKTWHARDACGNTSGTVSQTIAVVDTTPPTIGNAGANATIFCPSQPVFTAPTAADGCSTAIVFQVSDVTTPGSCGTYSRTVTWQARDACNNLSPQRSQTIVVECNNCGGLTMGFWQNKNGQAIITGGSKTGTVANSGTWLRQYAPFQDLSATATPAQVATYVTNIIKAANASGAAMNAMLKAQMLATALDVYFSDPALGGNQIGAPAPLGTVKIDLTHINKPIGSGTYENTTAAFGGGSCQTVSALLSYASGQSNSGGTVWYGQVKATQELAKDIFDAINNNVAFSCL